MSQHSANTIADNNTEKAAKIRQILPLLAAMLPALCGLGFQIAGPRSQKLES
ncbi:MAG: hypothetical protein HQ518_18145 [Rhodopirellula sp.]|nr:hypothetical protein [Rhodopirellula sp.]